MLSTIVFIFIRAASSVSRRVLVALQAMLLVVAIIVGVAVVVVVVVSIPITLWLGIALITLFGLATFPRSSKAGVTP